MTQSWNKPVTVEARKTGQRVAISSTERAAEYMMNEWPTIEDGEAFHKAIKSLQAVHEGKVRAEEAREAFLAALDEGDIYVFDE